MERIIEAPKQISICFIGGSAEKSKIQMEALSPLSERYEIDYCLRSDVYTGMYTSFSQIVNELISDSKHEFMIFVSEKVNPTPEQAEDLINHLCSGFCWASKVAFGFFAMTKELYRNIGLLDERFIGSEWEDIDFLCRMYMFGKAIKWEYDRSEYPPVPSRIGPLRGASLTAFRQKWIESGNHLILDSEYLENKRLRAGSSRPDIKESWLPKESSIFFDDNNHAYTIFGKEIFAASFEKEQIFADSNITISIKGRFAYITFECEIPTEISMQILNSRNELATNGLLISSNERKNSFMFSNVTESMQIKIFHEGDKIFHDRNTKIDSETKIKLGLSITKKTMK